MNMTLRLILGDQLNYNHSWFKQTNEHVLYLLMEVKQETDYVKHHIQKIIGIFMAMRQFASYLKNKGHQVMYIKIGDENNRHRFNKNLDSIISEKKITRFEYLFPDEYRLDEQLKDYCKRLKISTKVYDTEHFYTHREEVKQFFEGSKQILMEHFYRHMRKKHDILMKGKKPEGGSWNYDKENRKRIPEHLDIPVSKTFGHDITALKSEIDDQHVEYFGSLEPEAFMWPVNRNECLDLLDYFKEQLLPHFGDYQDAMTTRNWSLYHSRLSFALNTKMLSPKEVIHAVLTEWNSRKNEIDISQVEGFVRQIIGWREFMRGIYWWQMPEYEKMNYLRLAGDLPGFYWTGDTKMNCMHHAIKQSLEKAYAHHIQRLMVTGNFALLAGIHPDQVNQWYLGIYIDAIQWVELTNTHGMSQFADGGIIATKPYISSASYMNKMSNYCKTCFYDHKKKHGDHACPFNSLYWHFFEQHRDKLGNNQRLRMMYNVWERMKQDDKQKLLNQAKKHLDNLDNL